VTGNEKWKGLTWGMIPLHASGVAACTYHFFYNAPSLQFVVELQAFLTLVGNCSLAFAAYRIAESNGWSLAELNPLPQSNTSPRGLKVEMAAAVPLDTYEAEETNAQLAIKLAVLTFIPAYLVKYGELGVNFPLNANPLLASAMIFTPPALVAASYYNRGELESGRGGVTLPALPGFGKKDGEEGSSLSFQDVKRYGKAGTLAYVLTEVAFWAVAFPVASYALFQTSGRWPDVVNIPEDRATVLGFIFAGANVARLAVPLRLGAALALAPWVDENILGGEAANAVDSTEEE